MAMNVQSLLAYGNYQNGSHTGSVKGKKETQNAEKTAKDAFVSNGEKQLSKAAQEVLEKLRASRSDMDFMVADVDKGDNAREILSRSNKEFTVMFSSDELEKMAADEKYYQEKLSAIDGAVRMSEEINAQFGFERAFGKTDGMPNDVGITKFGIVFHDDGSTTLFAELEKSSAMQKERMEKIQEKNAEEKKEAARKEKADELNTLAKRVTVQASSKEELLQKIGEIDWSKVQADYRTVGTKFDYSI